MCNKFTSEPSGVIIGKQREGKKGPSPTTVKIPSERLLFNSGEVSEGKAILVGWGQTGERGALALTPIRSDDSLPASLPLIVYCKWNEICGDFQPRFRLL